jgi:hypothetical protein
MEEVFIIKKSGVHPKFRTTPFFHPFYVIGKDNTMTGMGHRYCASFPSNINAYTYSCTGTYFI